MNQKRSRLPQLFVASYGIFYGILGLVALFVPDLALRGLGWPAEAEIVMSFVAPGLLAVAVMNWHGRTAIYGGIYGRPILLANLMMGATAGYPLLADQWQAGLPLGVVLGAVVLMQFPLGFYIMQKSPV